MLPLQSDLSGVPTSTMAIIGSVVLGLLGVVTYVVKAQSDKIAPALQELTRAVLLLPGAIKEAIHDAVSDRRGAA